MTSMDDHCGDGASPRTSGAEPRFHTTPSHILSAYFSHLENSSALRWRGRVVQVVGQIVESEGPFCTVGEACEIIDSRGRRWPGEIVGFRGHTVLSIALPPPTALRYGPHLALSAQPPS